MRYREDCWEKLWSEDESILTHDEPCWFIVDDVYAGVYCEPLHIMCMADEKGFNISDTVCFAPVGASRQVASYPKHGERVAVEIPQLPCIATGTFNMKYLEEGAVDPIPAIELDPIYDFGDVSGAIAWSNVFAWYKVPEIPSYLCYDKTNIVECPTCEEECCDEVADEDLEGAVDIIEDITSEVEDAEVVEEESVEESSEETSEEEFSSEIVRSKVEEAVTIKSILQQAREMYCK